MSAPTKKLEELVLSQKLRHAGNPVLRWMAGNVAIEQDAADNWKPSKKKSQERIDGMVALVMGIDLATRHIESKSIYSEPGAVFVDELDVSLVLPPPGLRTGRRPPLHLKRRGSGAPAKVFHSNPIQCSCQAG